MGEHTAHEQMNAVIRRVAGRAAAAPAGDVEPGLQGGRAPHGSADGGEGRNEQAPLEPSADDLIRAAIAEVVDRRYGRAVAYAAARRHEGLAWLSRGNGLA